MQPLDEGSLIRPCAELLGRSPIEALQERVAVDGQDEDGVEELDEGRVVARAAAEERGLYAQVGYERSYLCHVPQVVVMAAGLHRCAGGRVAAVGQLTIAMDGMVATPEQLVAHRGLAAGGYAFDEIVLPAHRRRLVAWRRNDIPLSVLASASLTSPPGGDPVTNSLAGQLQLEPLV